MADSFQYGTVSARAGRFLSRLRRLLPCWRSFPSSFSHGCPPADGRVESATWGANCCGQQKSAKPKAQPPGDRDFEAVRQHGARSGIPRRSGKESETAADGTVTVYGYNELKQKISETKKGLAPDGSGDITTFYTYDLDNRVLSVSVTNAASGLGYVNSRRAYDLGGRETNHIDRLGNATATSYGTLTTTVVRPNGVTAVTERYPDGKTKHVLENGVVKHSYAYGVNPDGAQWTLAAQGPLPVIAPLTDVADLRPLTSGLDCPWQLTVSDALGRTVAIHAPGFGGTVLVSSNAYDTAGNLLRSESSSAGGVYAATLFSYHPDGTPHLSALDLNTNGVIDLDGPDRVTGISTTYEYGSALGEANHSLGEGWWHVSRQWVYPESGSASVVTTSVSRVLLTGLGAQQGNDGILTALTEAIDVRGNVTTACVLIDRTAKKVTNVTVLPTSVQSDIRTTINGLLVSTLSSTAVTNTYAYDGLARQISMTDGRGNTSTTAYTLLGLVAYTENAAGNRTSYAYDVLGRRIAVTDALTNMTYTAYDADNRVLATWGATYPVRYEYDALGRMTAMRTYRTAGGADVPSADMSMPDPDSGDETLWLYDNPTGLLTNKVYADGLGPAYTYTPDGKLASRLWARGISTTYTYAPFSGELTSVDYSDATPATSYTYDRLGNSSSVTDASGTRTFSYTQDGQTLTDVIQFQNEVFALHEAYDALGRSAGYALSNSVASTSSLIAGTGQGHDALGRISEVSVAGIPSPFQYAYLPSSDLVSSLAMPNGVTRQTAYGPHRDLLASITHTNTAGVILTRRTFSYDAAARLTARTQYRLGDDTNRVDVFGYNPRSELTQAAVGTNAYAYAYDPIGNRQTAEEPDFSAIYGANSLNQYTNISYGQAPVLVPVFDLDGNQTLLKTATGIWHVRYNGENRPVCFSNDTAVVDMDYDYMGRRFLYRETVNGAVTRHERHLYRDYLRIAAMDMLTNATVIHTIVWDPVEPIATRPLLLQTPSSWCTYGFDQVKNVTELFNESGVIPAAYDYAPFGAITHSPDPVAPLNPITFSSEVNDAVLGLVYYNWRHYNPLDGRWGRCYIGEYFEHFKSNKKDIVRPMNEYIFIYNNSTGYFDFLWKNAQSPESHSAPHVTVDTIYKCSYEQKEALKSAVSDICGSIDSCGCEATKDQASKKAQQYIKDVCEQKKDSLIKDFVIGCASDSEPLCKYAWGFYPPNSRRAIICNKSFDKRPGGVKCTLIHELGHVATKGFGGETPAVNMTKCLDCPPP